jgi:hypothetical protein
VSISWSVSNSSAVAPLLEFQLQYEPEGTGFFTDIPDFNQSMGLTQSRLQTGLAVSTRYTYRVRARNDVGWSNYSAVQSVQTPGPPPRSNLTAKIFSATAITFEWSVPDASVTSYQLQQSVGGMSATWETFYTGTAVVYLSTAFKLATTYQFRVIAVNQVGSSRRRLWRYRRHQSRAPPG